MRQKQRFLKTVGIGVAAFSVMVVIPSCIDSLYDLKNGLSSEMGLGGDSLSVPLGGTDTLRLSDFLDSNDVAMLKTMEDGGYGITRKDSIDKSFKVEPASIDDKTFSQSKTVSFGDISLENFKIPGVSVNSDISLSLSSISLGNFAIPAISKNESFSAGMSGYALTNPTISDLVVNGGKDNIFSGISLPPDPGVNPPIELIIDDPEPVSFSSTNNVTYNIDVPDGVTGINRIDLATNPNAKFIVSIELAGASNILTAGTITPNITLNPSDLFIFDNPPTGNIISFGSSDVLNASNGYKQTKTYNINAFNITDSPSGGKLNIAKSIVSNGSMSVTGAKAWSNKIAQVGNMNLIVKVSVIDVVIESMDFNIPTLQTNISGNTPFSINNTIPGEINKINTVLFNDPAKIVFDLNTLNLPTMVNKTITIDELKLNFPDEFIFEPTSGLVGHTYTLTNVAFNPAVGKKIELNIKELNMSGIPVTSGSLNWSSGITYAGKVSFAGRINSKNIPTASNDTKMAIDVSSSLSFKSAEVTTNVISKALPNVSIPITMDVNIASQVKSLGVVNLNSGTKIRINIAKPTLPLTLSGNNIQIQFPSLFTFKPALPLNTYTINGTIPDVIELELASLNINKPLTNGKLTLNENIVVSGGANLLAGNVSSSEIDGLSGKKLSLVATTSDLTIASTTVQLNSLTSNFADSTKLEFTVNDLPTEIVALDSIILSDNASLQLTVDITNMPAMSNPLMANLAINFPELLRFAPGSVDAQNKMIINQAFVNGKLTKTIPLKGLHFNGQNLNGQLNINEKLKFDVGVSVNEPNVNSSDLNGNPIGVTVQVKLTGISFKSVYGKVDPGIDPITNDVSLSDLPDFMKGEDVVLDITKPIIALETQSNLGLPVNATMTLIPMKNGSEVPNSKQTVVLNIPKASSANDSKKTYFWIAPDSAGMPQNYLYVPAEIQTLFKIIPDNIKFKVDVQSDMSQQHFVNLNVDYKIKVKYDVTVPMAFGKDLSIVIRDTITDLDESIGKIAFSGKGMELYGTFWNSIPLELELQVKPLDGDNQYIPVVPATQIINAGAYDGSANETNLLIKLNDPDGLLKDVRGFEMVFKATSNETVAGTPIKPDNFVKADLKVRLNGGIKIGDK